MTAIRLQHEDRGGTAVVTVSGEVNIYTAPCLREMLMGFTGSGTGPVPLVVVMDEVTFLDSTGVGVLVGAMRAQETRGGDFGIVCSSEPVLRVLQTMGLLGRMGVRGSVDEALAEVKP